MNDQTNLTVRLQYTASVILGSTCCFLASRPAQYAGILGGLILGALLGRTLEPRFGTWLRQRGAERLYPLLMGAWMLICISTQLLAQPVIGAGFAAAIITLILGNGSSRFLRWSQKFAAARLKRFSRPVMLAPERI